MDRFYIFKLSMQERQGLTTFLRGNQSKTDIILEIIQNVSETADAKWIVRNISEYNDIIYFKFGRLEKVDLFKPDSKDIIVKEEPNYPFSYIVYYPKRSIILIELVYNVAQKIDTIKNSFVSYLNNNSYANTYGTNFELEYYYDDRELKMLISKAFYIKYFSYTIKKPNPSESKSMFIQPLQHILTSTDGKNIINKIEEPKNKEPILEEWPYLSDNCSEIEAEIIEHEGEIVHKVTNIHSTLAATTKDTKEKNDEYFVSLTSHALHLIDTIVGINK